MPREPAGQTLLVIDRQASAYGDTHAGVYDRIYGARFMPDAAVAALVEAAGTGGRILKLGVGTGRLAIPLTRRGVHVDGIEASSAMIDVLRSQPGSSQIRVFQVDLADFDLPDVDYDVAVIAVSTLFMLPDRAAQQSCLASTAKHMRPGGRLFVEAFRLDPARYANGLRVETRPDPGGGGHVVRSRHDPVQERIHITHELSDGSGSASYKVTLHYATLDQLDALAASSGLTLAARWADWTAQPVNESSADPVSVYTLRRPRADLTENR